MIPLLSDTLTFRKEKDLHARVVRCKFKSGMKGIYVRDGIKIYIYSENEFDEVTKSFCVYGGCLNLYLSLPSNAPTRQHQNSQLVLLNTSTTIFHGLYSYRP